MIVPHGRHLAVLLRWSDIGNLVQAGVAPGTSCLGELVEGAPGERLKDIGHRVPGAADKRVVGLIAVAGAVGELLLMRHDGPELTVLVDVKPEVFVASANSNCSVNIST